MIILFDSLEISAGTMDDLSGIFRVLDTTGWGETEDDVRRVIRNPNNKYFVIYTPESEIIGIILAVKYKTIGFIGHVVVLPEYRGMGLGEQLMIEANQYLERSGCKTIKLDAVDKARSLYERTGYIFELNSLRFKLDLSSEEKIETYNEKRRTIKQLFPVHNIKEDDLSQVFETDKEIFGSDRNQLLLLLFEEFPEFSFITRDTEDFLAGYSFGLFKNNTLIIRAGISDSLETTVNLIDAAIKTALERGVETTSIGIVENSKWGIEALKKLGFEQVSFSLRMYRGEKTDKTINPAIFAIGDPAKG